MAPHQSVLAKNYFNELTKSGKYGDLKDKGQQYMFCLMIGLINQRRASQIGKKDEIMVRGWSEPLKDNKHLILASVLAAEIERKNLPTDKLRYRELMMQYLSGDDGLYNLTKEGFDLFDQYSEGGFQLISENIPKPTDFDAFLYDLYTNFLRDEFNN